MKRSLMCAVTAFGLLAGSSLAQSAEKPAGGDAPAAGGAAGEQKLPPGGAAPKAAPAGAEKMPGATGGGASPGMKPTTGAEPQPGQRQKGENAGVEPNKAGQAGDQMQPKSGAEGEVKPGQKGNEAKPAANETKPGAEAGKPAAQAGKPSGAARPAPKLTQTQTTEVRTAFQNVHVQPVHVDFHVDVGVAVPRTVVLEPVPREIITIVPEYEGFRFFVVPGEIVIVDPETFEIVYILPL